MGEFSPRLQDLLSMPLGSGVWLVVAKVIQTMPVRVSLGGTGYYAAVKRSWLAVGVGLFWRYQLTYCEGDSGVEGGWSGVFWWGRIGNVEMFLMDLQC